jgi:hypothetical protein
MRMWTWTELTPYDFRLYKVVDVVGRCDIPIHKKSHLETRTRLYDW